MKTYEGELFYTYILTNKNNTVLYVGFTIEMSKRLSEHIDKVYKNSFSAKYNLNKLIYFETHNAVGAARKREKQLKKWNREWKENLVQDMNPDWGDLSWMLEG